MPLAPYSKRTYAIFPYDPSWPEKFQHETIVIRRIFGDGFQLEHIGSTAIPGMSGKDCIDVLVIVDDLAVVDAHVEKMSAAGYEYAGAFVTDNSRLFRKMDGDAVRANIHFFPKNHPHVKEMLAVRSYFLEHPEKVIEYSDFKLSLYEKYPQDYAAYRKEKDVYMAQIQTEALKIK